MGETPLPEDVAPDVVALSQTLFDAVLPHIQSVPAYVAAEALLRVAEAWIVGMATPELRSAALERAAAALTHRARRERVLAGEVAGHA